jgi:1-acyl-sn-glycerol-3-phosphate acyltransferase
VAEFLEPIAPGLDKQVFFDQLQQVIESATARLVEEGEHGLGTARRDVRED